MSTSATCVASHQRSAATQGGTFLSHFRRQSGVAENGYTQNHGFNRKRWEKHASPLEFTIKFWGEIPIIVKPKWFPVHGFKKPSDTTTKNQLIYHWNATPRHHERDQKPGPVGQTSLFQMGLWIVAVDVHHHLAGVHKSLGKSPYCVICMFRHTSLFPFSNMLSLPTSSDISIMCLGRVFRLHLLFLLP